MIVLAVVAGGAASMRSGSLRNWLTRRVISGGIVAEKNKRLAARRQQLADLLDVRDEAHVEHAVGLVDDEDLHAHQHDAAALEMIEQPPGRGDQDVDAAVELLDLVVHRHAADEQRQVELVVDAVFLEALRHLGGELACRRQDQRARHAGPSASRLQPAIIGNTKEAVLPVPVCAMPSTSRPVMATGMAAAWIGVGEV